MAQSPHTGDAPAADAVIDHIEFFVADADGRAGEWVDAYGFQVVATAEDACRRSVVLRRCEVVLVVTQGLTDDHPAAEFTLRHGDGVGSIALRVADAEMARSAAVATGAVTFAGRVVGFGDVTHTFVEPVEDPVWSRPGFEATISVSGGDLDDPLAIDHIAVCLEQGMLEPTVRFYERELGWRQIFAESIHVGAQAMESKVVQSPGSGVTLTFLQPVVGAEPGQIDDFLKNHGGSGVQHLAFSVPNISRTVDTLAARGVEFLRTPSTYYQELARRLPNPVHPIGELSRRGILVDQDHDGQLFQIFTRSTHPRRTLFMEIIERQGAKTFGSNNIRKLYEAVERQHDLDAVEERLR